MATIKRLRKTTSVSKSKSAAQQIRAKHQSPFNQSRSLQKLRPSHPIPSLSPPTTPTN
jgi:hypothetical protein